MHDQNDACADHAWFKGRDMHSFECRKCRYIDVITVATDPMKSESAGRPNADLSAPTQGRLSWGIDAPAFWPTRVLS
jgi:hypothetical protein